MIKAISEIIRLLLSTKLVNPVVYRLNFQIRDWLIILVYRLLRQYFSLYPAVSHGRRKIRKLIDERKQPPPAPTVSAVGPCPTIIQISRASRHRKFCLAPWHHPTTPSNRAVSQGRRKMREMTDERKNIQTTSIRTNCKRSIPLPYYYPNE